MMTLRTTLALCVLIMASACNSTAVRPNGGAPAVDASDLDVTYSGGDGSSCDNAVVVVAKNERLGVEAEYRWLGTMHPGYAVKGQSLIARNDRPYDSFRIEVPGKGQITVCFDISSYFGKF